jgi:hypothetical protein
MHLGTFRTASYLRTDVVRLTDCRSETDLAKTQRQWHSRILVRRLLSKDLCNHRCNNYTAKVVIIVAEKMVSALLAMLVQCLTV